MDTIEKIREFNRFYTSQIGLVGRRYVSGGLSLSELRVLYELGQEPRQTARKLALGLGLDEGYLSRILTKFVKNGWLERTADGVDRRVRYLKLTGPGQAQAQGFVDEARIKTGEMIAGADAIDQERLISAMQIVQSVLGGGKGGKQGSDRGSEQGSEQGSERGSERGEVSLCDLGPGDAGWLIQQHGEIYQRDYGFDHSFEALVAEILVDFIKTRDPDCERAFIAKRDGQRLGSIFCMRQDSEVAKLRLFLLVPQARGLRLGHRMMGACVAYARSAGYKRMVLWTQKNLGAACALYAAHGFEITSEQDVHEFGADMVRQHWELQL